LILIRLYIASALSSSSPFAIQMDKFVFTLSPLNPKSSPKRSSVIQHRSELLAVKHALNHWRHIVEGSEIHIRTDHTSLSVYRQKNPMTRRLGKFMEEIKYYDPQIGYRPGRLQTVPDALSRIPGQREEGEPASAERFMELGEGEGNEGDDRAHDDVDERARDEDTPAQSTKPKIQHNTNYYENIRRYLQAKSIEKEVDEKIKKDAEMYALKEGALFDKDTGIRVVIELEQFEKIVEAVHKDLGHYGKKTTLDGVTD